VAERINYWISRGVQNAELRLDAFGGGAVAVSISVQGNEAMVEFRSDQPEARRLLAGAMPHLSELLEREGLVLSGGFVGTSAQDEPGARERKGNTPAARGAIVGVEIPASGAAPAQGRAAGRVVDLFV
jgi:flagellar hook-length control protein FliK